jgi:hypothetical protein
MSEVRQWVRCSAHWAALCCAGACTGGCACCVGYMGAAVQPCAVLSCPSCWWSCVSVLTMVQLTCGVIGSWGDRCVERLVGLG